MTSNNQDYIALIPDYLNNLLDKETMAEFEHSLSKDPNFKNELEEFKKLQMLYKDVMPKTPETSESVFNRIIEEIDSDKKTTARFQQINYTPTNTARVRELWCWLKSSISIPWGLAFIQAAVIVLLLIPGSPDNTYKTLSLTKETNTNNKEISLNIVFDESTREHEIRKLLISVNGTIIAGPSPQGRYQITIPVGNMEQQTISTIKESGLVLFLEKSF